VALADLSILKMDTSGLIIGEKIVQKMQKEAQQNLQIEDLPRYLP
jgi:hypothetical protein